ncbi:MAG: hypothetical protein PHO08_03655 [Methylococcales bacterium]|nr:hypothetical protein [Methylococcales bacterium]
MCALIDGYLDYFNSIPYLAEQTLGWDHKTIELGINELRTGIVCVENFKARGNLGMGKNHDLERN